VAREVRDGAAAVVFADEKSIEYCDVLALLRVAERKAQFDEAGEP
jgi:exodeoxyribonuclease-5